MIGVQPLTVAEFLRLRHQLVDDHNVTLLSKLDEQLAATAESDPDRAAELLQAMADSDRVQDRTTAAIYVDTLHPARPEQAHALLLKLLQDPDEGVRAEAFDTLETMVEEDTISTDEAARLAQVYHAVRGGGGRQCSD